VLFISHLGWIVKPGFGKICASQNLRSLFPFEKAHDIINTRAAKGGFLLSDRAKNGSQEQIKLI
jgi:hypothetical protein